MGGPPLRSRFGNGHQDVARMQVRVHEVVTEQHFEVDVLPPLEDKMRDARLSLLLALGRAGIPRVHAKPRPLPDPVRQRLYRAHRGRVRRLNRGHVDHGVKALRRDGLQSLDVLADEDARLPGLHQHGLRLEDWRREADRRPSV
eukprot:scaffold340_cov256-Pinguiococcus_pyrenoidosus.AAC.4